MRVRKYVQSAYSSDEANIPESVTLGLSLSLVAAALSLCSITLVLRPLIVEQDISSR